MMTNNLQKMLSQTPKSLKRLGTELFLKIPLYRTKFPLEVIYINEQLFNKLYGDSCSWEQKSQLIQESFSLCLDPSKSTGEQCGWAYVDRQKEDAYGISLMGNQGSGRAFYTGSCFNIKGERTPLATSSHPTISNGILYTEDGIWSAFIGNSLYEEFQVKPSPVLAILRIDVSRCIIVRMDEDGALDRLTHLFYQEKCVSVRQIKQAAKNWGRLEAEKFIHRILHGSWSAGNTSLAGHLIDYDSMCAVKGRQAQYSITPKYPDNCFGFEYLGQIKNLKGLLESCSVGGRQMDPADKPRDVEKLHPDVEKLHPDVGKLHPDVEKLQPDVEKLQPDVGALPRDFGNELRSYERLLINSFKNNTAEGLVYLMGFADYKLLTKQFKSQVKKLAAAFCDLSHYTFYISTQSLYINYPSALFFHLFDFSAFFRVFPLLQLSKQFTQHLGLHLLMNSSQQHAFLLAEYNSIGRQELSTAVLEQFGSYLLDFEGVYSMTLERKIRKFIDDYEQLFEMMQEYSGQTREHVATRAYVLNEDRFYMLSVFSLDAALIKLHRINQPQVINRFIADLIKANQRIIKDGWYQANMRLFDQGYVFVLLQEEGTFQVVFQLYKDKIDLDVRPEDQWQIALQGRLVAARVDDAAAYIQIISEPLPSIQLAFDYSREDYLVIHPYGLYRNQMKVILNDLFFPDHDTGYYL
ncbi:MAG: hypothetical protein WC627_01250 [Legionella sp.]|jgi:hypothetical protein